MATVSSDTVKKPILEGVDLSDVMKQNGSYPEWEYHLTPSSSISFWGGAGTWWYRAFSSQALLSEQAASDLIFADLERTHLAKRLAMSQVRKTDRVSQIARHLKGMCIILIASFLLGCQTSQGRRDGYLKANPTTVYAQSIAEGLIQIGMSRVDAIARWGKPDRSKVSVGA